MKILMVYPSYPNTFWSFKYAMKYIKRKASFPPLGLLTIAPLLPKHYDIRLIDMNVKTLRDKDLRWADMVFISAMEVQKNSLKEVVERCRSIGTKTVAGGPLFTTQSDAVEGIDHLILDEAETTLGPFLKDLESGKMKKIYSSKIRPDITKTPIPKWDLIDHKKYATMLIQFSRGCPFNCEFCDIAYLNGRYPRTKTPEQIISEIESLYEMGWRQSIFFVDDNFIGNRKEVKSLLSRVIRWQKDRGYPLTFLTEASLDLADDTELLELMAAANFNKVFLGIETPNTESLKECNKVQNLTRDISKSINKIQQYGMEVMGGFIVGFDNDTESIFQDQIDFIQTTGVVTAMVGLLNAIPKTPLWERLKKEGRLRDGDEGWNTEGTLNFTPKMDMNKLTDGYKKIISTIYSPKEYYKRIDIFLKAYKPGIKSRIKTDDIRPFIRSLWRIGILSKSRIHFWKLFIKTLVIRRRSFPKAMELAIIGHHLQKVSRIVSRS